MTHRSVNPRGIRPEIIKRVVIYGVLILLVSTAQCSFFSQLDICPSTPDLIIGIVISISLLDSVRSASVVGIAAGFLTDALGNGGALSFSAIFYLIAAVIIGALASKMLPRFLSWILLLLPALLIKAVYTFLCICIKIHTLPPMSVIGSVILPEIIVTAIICIPLYPIVKLCVIPMNARSRFTF